MRPQPGAMIYWRFKGDRQYRFGYCTYIGELLRLGNWNGDTMGGAVVDPIDIEWKPFSE